jgi:hypothetical protein
MPTLRLAEIDISQFDVDPLEHPTVARHCEQVIFEISCWRTLARSFVIGSLGDRRLNAFGFLPLHGTLPPICSASSTSARFMRGLRIDA